jgi:hypothetical protein
MSNSEPVPLGLFQSTNYVGNERLVKRVPETFADVQTAGASFPASVANQQQNMHQNDKDTERPLGRTVSDAK